MSEASSSCEDLRRVARRIPEVTVRAGTIVIATATALLLALAPATANGSRAQTMTGSFQASREFQLGPGRAVRTFSFRERGGVILLNRLTVRRGVRVVVDAWIPHLAGARVVSWQARNDPSRTCRSKGDFVSCTQDEEWCPMPQATWQFRLVKQSGPAGRVRFDYLVDAPPPGS